MVLKGLALGAAVAAVAVAIFVALTFQPARATVTAPASNVVVLPNGMAAPQLQPAPQGAPALIEGEVSLSSALRANIDSASSAALELRHSMSKPATTPSSTNAVEYQAVKSCGGN